MGAEHKLQNEIRNALAGKCHAFRANIGRAWTGSECIRLPNGDMLIKQPRPFDTGLPAGFSDLFGNVTITITPDMVGKQIAQPFYAEVKTPTGRVSDIQGRFLQAMAGAGARAGVVRSVDDALALVRP